MVPTNVSPRQWSISALILLAVASYFSFLIYVQIFLRRSGDFSTHAKLDSANYSYTYLYILRDGLAGLFDTSGLVALTIILVAAIFLNIGVAFWFLLSAPKPPIVVALATAAMFLFVPFYNLLHGGVYLGQLSPNIWHNSTFLIAATPNLLLFLYGMDALQRPLSATRILILTALAILSIASKPSLFVVLVPAMALYALLFRRDLILRGGLLWSLPIVVFVLYYLFVLPQDVETIIAPGLVWHQYSSNIPYSVFTSMIFFIVLAAVYGRRIALAPEFVTSLLAIAVGAMQFYLLAEPGDRQNDGNYSWGMHQAMTLLLFVSLAFLLRQPWDRRAQIAVLALLPHLVTGVYYTLRIMRTGHYWI